MRNFIIDQEINLDNGQDFLKTQIYADNLEKVIENSPSKKVFTIGLFGGWGAGKSSIVETAADRLNKKHRKKIRFIKYDAWKYANDSFRRMFLLEVQEKLGFDRSELMNKFYVNESKEVGVDTKISYKKLGLLLLSCIVAISLVAWLVNDIQYQIPIYSAIGLIGLVFSLFMGVFNDLKVSIHKPHLFAPEQFEDCFKQMLAVSLKQYNWIERIRYVITNDSKTAINLDKLVIIIDNIDRCHKEQAYELLTDIKSFLSNEQYNVVFVIPVDDEALRKHILNNSKNDEDEVVKDKEEFLRKFFNVTIRIKPHQPIEMFEFAQALNEKYDMGYNTNTINIASKEYAKNPRRVIQLFNNLAVELNLFDEEFAIEHETLICKLVIIREEYPDYYTDIISNPQLFVESIKPEGSVKSCYLKPELERLLNETKSYTRGADVKTISKILTNTDNVFADIPLEIKTAIDSCDVTKAQEIIPKWASEKSNFNRLVSYCNSALNRGLKHSLWGSDFLSSVDFICQLNKTLPFPLEANNRYSEKIIPGLSHIVLESTYVDDTLYYSNCLDSQGLGYFKKAILDAIVDQYKSTKKSKLWDSYFERAISIYTDKYALTRLQSVFWPEYKNNKYTIEGSTIPQLQYLVSKESLEHAIQSLTTLEATNQFCKDLKFYFDNVRPTLAIVEKLLQKFDTLFNIQRGTKKETLLGQLEIINSIVLNIHLEKNATSIKPLYDKVISNRKIPSPVHPQIPSQDKNIRLIDEISKIPEEASILLEFIFHAYTLSKGSQCGIDILTELARNPINLPQIKNELLKLRKRNDALIPLFPIVALLKDYDEDDTRDLLEHMFICKKNSAYALEETHLKDKLEEILLNASTGKNNLLYNYLANLAARDMRIKATLVSIIISKDASFIQTLPSELMRLAVENVNKTNINDYSNNINFLCMIAEYGNDVQKTLLTSLINSKLENEQEREMGYTIIKCFKSIKSTDCKYLITQLGRLKEEDTIKEQESELTNINDLVSYLKALTNSKN